jgi:DNA-binding transcriptional ArsR family regulator
VGRLAAELGLSQPNVSQHLAVLRVAGLVEAERDGREARYRLVDPDVMVACGIMRGVLERRLRRLAALSATAEPVITPTSQATTSSQVASASS